MIHSRSWRWGPFLIFEYYEIYYRPQTISIYGLPFHAQTNQQNVPIKVNRVRFVECLCLPPSSHESTTVLC